MLLSADIKSLEIVTAAYLSKDQLLCQEVIENKDFHTDNKIRFKLPDRVTAKRFVFKLLYGATAYGYANDGDFIGVSTSQKFWQGIIDEFYNKYRGIGEWHRQLMRTALESGVIVTPSGRRYEYPSKDVAAREWFWRPKVLNYSVQGLGTDLVMLARISLWRRIKYLEDVLPVSSVHDSIVLDVSSAGLDKDDGLCYNIGVLVRKVVQDVPKNFQRVFGQPFDLPLDATIKVGQNLGHMEEVRCS